MKSSIKKNIGYQTIYQILNTCLPLITAPYLSRVLGASNLGVYSYITSISGYFTLLAMLGIVNHGTRSIAACQGERNRISTCFKEIYTVQFISSALWTIMYIFYLGLFCRDNRLIAIIQGIAVASCLFDINWLFFGVEQFKLTVIRNMVVRVSTVILIILLVKTENDLWIYTLLMAASTFVSNIVLIAYLNRILDFRAKIDFSAIKKHIKPIIKLFIPLLAMSFYHLMDKTMLGWFSTYEQSGYYYNADKIINIPVGIIIGVGTVLLPRVTALIENGKKQEANNLFLVTVEGLAALSTAIAFGIAAISKEFIPFFFGRGYEACISLTIALAPVLIIKGFSLTIRNVYLIPNQKDKCYITSVIAGAAANLVANIVLIPIFDALGAVVGTLIAELVACLWQYISIKKEVRLRGTLVNCIAYPIIGIIMFCVVRFVSAYLSTTNSIVSLGLEIITGATVYSILCILFWKITHNTVLDSFIKH